MVVWKTPESWLFFLVNYVVWGGYSWYSGCSIILYTVAMVVLIAAVELAANIVVFATKERA
jgi:hypothetical protein